MATTPTSTGGGLAHVWQEFKNASPGGKALAITAVIAVAGLGLYTLSQNSSSSSSNGTLVPIGLDTGGTLPTAGTGTSSDSSSSSSGTGSSSIGSVLLPKPATTQRMTSLSSTMSVSQLAHYVYGSSNAISGILNANPGLNANSILQQGSFVVIPKGNSTPIVTTSAGDTLNTLAHYAFGTSSQATINSILAKNPALKGYSANQSLPANVRVTL
jgi:phage tail protein X